MGDDDRGLRDQLIDQLVLLGQIEATQTALFQQKAAAKYGLGIAEMKALDILVREGSATAGRLVEALNLTSGAVTGVIDRLERRGLAHRRPDPADRRRVRVEPNLATLAAGDNVYRGIGSAFAALHAGYSTAELQFLVRHYQAAIEITTRETRLLATTAEPEPGSS